MGKSGTLKTMPSPASFGEAALAAREASDPAFDEKTRAYVLEKPDKAWREYERHACRVDLLGGGSHFKRFWRRWVHIRTEDRGLIRPEMGWIQRALNDEIERQLALNIPVRIRILKPRKAWVSTLVEIRMYHRIAIEMTHRDALVVAQDFKTADYLIRIAKTVHRNCPTWLVPVATADGRDIFGFDSRDALIEVKTASRFKSMHGRTPTFGHLSEVARWDKNAELTAEAVYNAIPMLPGSIAIEETVANGKGGYFAEQWAANEEMRNAGMPTEWTNLFQGWLAHAPYQADLYPSEEDGKFEKSLDHEERTLVSLHHATLKQLKWRRRAIESRCHGSVESFHEMFPTTPQEAFLTSGRAYFGEKCKDWLLKWEATVDEPKPPIDIPLETTLTRIKDGVERKVPVSATLRVWEEPKPDREYILYADSAEGADPSGTNRDPDFSVADIRDKRSHEQVAELRGRFDLDLFAELCMRAGYYFNTAMIGWERHHGGEVLTMAFQNASYPNVFCRVNMETGAVTMGVETTAHTRTPMLAEAKGTLRDGDGRIRSRQSIAEHFNMIVDHKGRIVPAKGHDDCVFARAGCMEMLRQLSTRDEQQETVGNPHDPKIIRERERKRQADEMEEDARLAREDAEAEWETFGDDLFQEGAA